MRQTVPAWGRRALLATGVVALGAAHLYERFVPAPTATVLWICNAETQSAPAEDPPLSVAGLERAQAFARLTAGSGLTAIYAAPPQRARQTAQPAATQAGLEISPLPPDAEAVADLLRYQHDGPIAMAGRCSESRAMLARLTGQPPQSLPPIDAESLVVVTLVGGRPVSRLHLRYGDAGNP